MAQPALASMYQKQQSEMLESVKPQGRVFSPKKGGGDHFFFRFLKWGKGSFSTGKQYGGGGAGDFLQKKLGLF